MITNKLAFNPVSGQFDEVLNTIATDDITNTSGVSGATDTAALNNLLNQVQNPPGNLQLLSTLAAFHPGTIVPGPIAVMGNIAYVVDANEPVLYSINIADKTAPVLIQTLFIGSVSGMSITLQSNAAFIGNNLGQLVVVYLGAGPSNMSVLSTTNVDNYGSFLNQISIFATHYLACATLAGFAVVNVASLNVPVVVFRETGANYCGGAAYVGGNTVITTNLDYTFPDDAPYLKTWNVSTPGTPTITNTYTFPDSNSYPSSVYYDGTNPYVYVSDMLYPTTYIVDITTPTAPVLRSTITQSGSQQSVWPAPGMGVLNNTWLYLMWTSNAAPYYPTIQLYNVATKTAPQLYQTVTVNAATSYISGIGILATPDYIYVGAQGVFEIWTNINLNPIIGTLTTYTAQIASLTTAGYVTTDSSGHLSSVPIPAGGGSTVNTFTLSGTDISNKGVVLSSVPTTPADTILLVGGAPAQIYGVDFIINSSITANKTLSWASLGLDGILASGDQLIVSFF